jgi:hypothetical protein
MRQSAGSSPPAALNAAGPSSTRPRGHQPQTSSPAPPSPLKREPADPGTAGRSCPGPRRTNAPKQSHTGQHRSQPRSWSPWSAPGPHGSENRWSSAGTSGHGQRVRIAGQTPPRRLGQRSSLAPGSNPSSPSACGALVKQAGTRQYLKALGVNSHHVGRPYQGATTSPPSLSGPSHLDSHARVLTQSLGPRAVGFVCVSVRLRSDAGR